MGYAPVQTPAGGAANASATSITLAFGSNVTAGSLIVVGWRYGSSARTVTLSDTLGNTYANVTASEAFNATDGTTVGIGYAMNSGAGADTVTFAISGAAANLRFAISEFSGGATSSAFDQANAATGNTSPLSAGSVTPGVNGELIFVVAHEGNNGDFTAGTDFTLNTTVPATGGVQRLATERYIQPTAASHAADFTFSSSGSQYAAGVATFKPAGAAAAASQARRPPSAQLTYR